MLKRLYDSHRCLEASAASLAALLDAPVPDERALKAARWDIGTRIMQHLALEDRYLFSHLLADQRPDVAALARQFQTRFAQYMADYAEHAKSWTAERVAADWAGYKAVTRKQLALLGERIRLVETQLFPLAGAKPLIASGAPSVSWAKEAFAIKDSIIGRA
jgi:hypothetical protein